MQEFASGEGAEFREKRRESGLKYTRQREKDRCREKVLARHLFGGVKGRFMKISTLNGDAEIGVSEFLLFSWKKRK